MRKQITTVLLVGSARGGPLVGFAAAPGNVQPETATKHVSTHAVPTHATKGVVKSVDASTLVITHKGKMGGEMTFALDPATHLQGTVAVGTPVDVRYREDGKTYVATAIPLSRPSHKQFTQRHPSRNRVEGRPKTRPASSVCRNLVLSAQGRETTCWTKSTSYLWRHASNLSTAKCRVFS